MGVSETSEPRTTAAESPETPCGRLNRREVQRRRDGRVGAQRERPYVRDVSGQRLQTLAGDHVPQPDGVAVGRRYGEPAVAGKRQQIHPLGMLVKVVQASA